MNYDTKYSESQINIQHFATLLYLLLFVSIIRVYNIYQIKTRRSFLSDLALSLEADTEGPRLWVTPGSVHHLRC